MTMQDFVKQWAATKKHKTWIEEYAQDVEHKLPHSREVRAALESFTFTPESFDQVADKPAVYYVRDGAAILRWLAKDCVVGTAMTDSKPNNDGTHSVPVKLPKPLPAKMEDDLIAG